MIDIFKLNLCTPKSPPTHYCYWLSLIVNSISLWYIGFITGLPLYLSGHGQITRDSSHLVKLKEEKLRKETKKYSITEKTKLKFYFYFFLTFIKINIWLWGAITSENCRLNVIGILKVWPSVIWAIISLPPLTVKQCKSKGNSTPCPNSAAYTTPVGFCCTESGICCCYRRTSACFSQTHP